MTETDTAPPPAARSTMTPLPAVPAGPTRTRHRASAVAELLQRLREPRPLICGILNVTPDSFSDGGAYRDCAAALAHGMRLVEEGADLLDVGGESTRPGARPPGVAEELRRAVPVIEELAVRAGVPVSVDTSAPEVMQAAVGAGAAMINDVRGLRQPGALATAAGLRVPVCLTHMPKPPSVMQDDPRYEDVLTEVTAFLRGRLEACREAGIPDEHLLIDPGFGFGKDLGHNLALLRSLHTFQELAPVLVGLSRKAMLGQITGRPAGQRETASVTAALLAVQRGAKVVRVHDVAAARDALNVLQAVG